MDNIQIFDIQVFLSEKAWRTLEDEIRMDEKSERRHNRQETAGRCFCDEGCCWVVGISSSMIYTLLA